MLVEQTERGDRMFTTMIRRHCALVKDLNAVAILPESTILRPLQPAPEDEHLHPQNEESLFNESYYFDLSIRNRASQVMCAWASLRTLPVEVAM
jgi:hypothetical protein